ncbi:MAG: hypothetical protein ABIB71_09300 [Candidatus Woesearchaeota archaeon]
MRLGKYLFAATLLLGCEADDSNKEFIEFSSNPVHLVGNPSSGQDWDISGTATYCAGKYEAKVFVHSNIRDADGIKEVGLALGKDFTNQRFVLMGTCERIFPNAIYHLEKRIANYPGEGIRMFYENCDGERHSIELEEVSCWDERYPFQADPAH